MARERHISSCSDLARGNDHGGPAALWDWGRNKAEGSGIFALTSPPQCQSSPLLQSTTAESAHNPRTFNTHLDKAKKYLGYLQDS